MEQAMVERRNLLLSNMDQIVSPFQVARRSERWRWALTLQRSSKLCDSYPCVAPMLRTPVCKNLSTFERAPSCLGTEFCGRWVQSNAASGMRSPGDSVFDRDSFVGVGGNPLTTVGSPPFGCWWLRDERVRECALAQPRRRLRNVRRGTGDGLQVESRSHLLNIRRFLSKTLLWYLRDWRC